MIRVLDLFIFLMFSKEKEPSFDDRPGFLDKLNELLKNLRILRLGIVLWNIIVIILMFILF